MTAIFVYAIATTSLLFIPKHRATGVPFPVGVLPPSGYGVVNPNVTQANIGETICKSGWTATIRPTTAYTNVLKKKQLAGYADQNMADYEEDHFISLQLGGSPTDPMNLWPELYTVMVNGVNLGARQKDTVETYLKRQVCNGSMTLKDAQSKILDWVSVYKTLKGLPSNDEDDL